MGVGISLFGGGQEFLRGDCQPGGGQAFSDFLHPPTGQHAEVDCAWCRVLDGSGNLQGGHLPVEQEFAGLQGSVLPSIDQIVAEQAFRWDQTDQGQVVEDRTGRFPALDREGELAYCRVGRGEEQVLVIEQLP